MARVAKRTRPTILGVRPGRSATATPACPVQLAARYVWWQDAATTLREPDRLLCQIMTLGTATDYVAACGYWGEDAFKRALRHADPGALDERSWQFWHRHFGLPMRPFPKRAFR